MSFASILREPQGGSDHHTAFVSDYVVQGVNAPMPTSTIPTTWHSTSAATSTLPKTPARLPEWISGWHFARTGTPGQRSATRSALPASLTALAEPSGIYFDQSGSVLFVNVLHRGGPGSLGTWAS